MFSSDDTIVAIATPPGRGGIGVVRVSGPNATDISTRILTRRAALVPRQATLTKVRLESAGTVHNGDHAVVTWFPSPHSYTGEHVVEISTHGSPVILRGIVSSLVAAGARLARPGEFTFRAFLNARLDLAQAEAVADLIDAATPLQAQIAFDQLDGGLSGRIEALDQWLLDLIARLEASLDFPDEGFHFVEPDQVAVRIDEVLDALNAVLADEGRGRVIRDGARVVIAGRVNAGKSSLFNALIGQERAIVSDVPGTTRDFLTEAIDLEGLAVTLVDTAGERQAQEAVELEGVLRAVRAREDADLVLIVIDSGEELIDEDRRLIESVPGDARLIVASKADREAKWKMPDAIRVSAARNTGLSDLRCAIIRSLCGDEGLRDPAAISNMRHVMLLKEARAALIDARTSLHDRRAPEEFVVSDLHRARACFGEVLGIGSSEETLEYIFKHFCIGK